MTNIKIFASFSHGLALIHSVQFFRTPEKHAEKGNKSCKYKNHIDCDCYYKNRQKRYDVTGRDWMLGTEVIFPKTFINSSKKGSLILPKQPFYKKGINLNGIRNKKNIPKNNF
jgi:hypothetical protein